MPFFKPRTPPQNDVEVILESIADGQFSDDTINELQRLADLSDDEEIDRIAETLLGYIVKTDDRNVLIGTVKALTVLPFLPDGKDEDVIRLMVTLFAVPHNMRITLQHKMLQNEILKFLLSMIKMDERYAKLMMSELIASMEYAYITDDAEAYPALEILARNNPEYFRPHTETLVKLLGSINKATRAQSAKLIGIIGGKYPEYVSSAMPILQSLASFYPDAQVKHNASEAYQILYHGLRLDVVSTVSMKDDDKPRQRSMGFADILKKKASELLSMPPHETPGERQRAARNAARERMSRDRTSSHHVTGSASTGSGHMTQPPSRATEGATEDLNLSDMEGFETEIKDILDRTREEFTNDAEGILNSIGVGHLSIMNRDKLTITSDDRLTKDTTVGDSDAAGQQPKTEKLPIHARTSHLDSSIKHKPAAEHDIEQKASVEPEKHAHHEKSRHEANEPHTEKHSKPSTSHSAHSPSAKSGFEKDLQGRVTARSIEKSPRLTRSPHVKISENKQLGRDAITLPTIRLPGEKDKPVEQVVTANEVEPAPEEIKAQAKPEIIQDIKPAGIEVTPDKITENTILLGPIKSEVVPIENIEAPIAPVSIKTEELPVEKIEIPIAPVSIKTEELPIQEKTITETHIRAAHGSIKSPETEAIERSLEIIKTDDKAVRQEPEKDKSAGPEVQNVPELRKLDLPPEKRVEKAMAWMEKPAAPAPVKPMGVPMEKGKTSAIREEPSAKRVEKALAWFGKVGLPEPEQPKIDRQPEIVEEGSGRVPMNSRPDMMARKPMPIPKTEPKVEAHHAQHHVKPATKPEAKQEEPGVEPTVQKPTVPTMDRKIESSVLPPRSAVSRHETSWSSDPITPPVARKIGVSKIGMTEKPLEGKDESKKGAMVPGTSISGFGPNKRIYQCPKCGGRTLVEGELCKVCKMTLEHPQEMVRCERCGLTNNRNIKFCRKCGAKLDKDKP